jgi:hypothetical protein
MGETVTAEGRVCKVGNGGGGEDDNLESPGPADGSTSSSVRVDSDVPAAVMFDPIELPAVLPEKLLELDLRGRADLDCKSNSKSSIISSRILSSSSASKAS